MTATQTARTTRPAHAAQPASIIAHGLYRLAVWDGYAWYRPQADLRGCRVDSMEGVTPPAQPSLLQLLERMERGGVAQLWIYPASYGPMLTPALDQLAEAQAAGWSVKLSRERYGVQAGAWISATHAGTFAIREIQYPALDPDCVWHDAPAVPGRGWRMALALATYAAATGALWFRSGGATGARLMTESMGTHRYSLTPESAPPPSLRPGTHYDGALLWLRDPTPAERHARYLVTVDRNGAWLSAAGMTALGVGAGVHVSGADAASIRRMAKAGMFRLVDYAPPLAPLARGLPDPLESQALRRGRDGWVSLPTLDLLDELGARYTIAEAHVWAQAHRVLEAWYKRLRDARMALIASGSRPALEMLKETYTKPLGRLATPSDETWDRASDALYRPDWYAAIKAQGRASLYRGAMRLATATGIVPFAASTDAWYYLLDERPEQLPGFLDPTGKLGYKLGRDLAGWKVAVYPMAEYPRLGKIVGAQLEGRLARLDSELKKIDGQRAALARAQLSEGAMGRIV